MSAVHVVTLFTPATQATDNTGASADIEEARNIAEETRAAVTPEIRVYVETWEGGEFKAHRELRADGWWLAESPSFAPTKEALS